MTNRTLPSPMALERPHGYSPDAPADALSKWAALAPSAAAGDPDTITIFDFIGEDAWTGGGFTAKRAAAALRSIGPKPVTVEINSPGGDMFEGMAIFNLLREHPAEVSVRVMGLAASAASIIAMAGDKITMSIGSMMMIHKAWGIVIGNDDDFTDAAEVFGKFNASMAEVYASRSGNDIKTVLKMLAGPNHNSDGTWMTAKEAVANGFADETTDDPEPKAGTDKGARADLMARRRVDAMLAQHGLPRSERRRLMREATGTHDAADHATPSAGIDLSAAAGLLALLKS